ncbi:tetratricopeptide repeat protein [Tautonia plasticadhaerens]|uniref:Anaphase-promoting complex, cyclosome, subunit 3 n=1 Tax=Tautonia plasticadhaerens TaxID=2527974 RepID=A0A518HFK4_9BACT|nr:tetratricopeptide repeat protein [Tautonia plasticadhaerens]QDV39624.1 Anaphase-promoting complex, cyclosome, subunit 3 [Tautonia plasticadhaerens]
MAELPTSTTWRFNWRAAAALAILALALGGSALALHLTQPGRVGAAARRQIEQLVEAGRPELALRHLGRYLQQQPDDADMLFLQARLLAEQAADVPTLERAGRLHDRLIRQFPGHPEVDEVRARLAELYILLSDSYRENFNLLGDPERAALEYRYRAAAQIARELIARRADDPQAHRLLGRALEGLAVPGAKEELDGAITSYERALSLLERRLQRDPDDAEAAEAVDEEIQQAAEVASRLARLHRDRAGDPEAAEAVLDRLVSTRPEDPRLRLARYAYYRELYDEGRAAVELQQALQLAPEDLAVRLAAAQHALHRGDPAAARAHLEAVPETGDARDDAVRRLVGGMIDFAEDRRILAMDRWREALIDVQGSNEELAWWLAYVQIRLGRVKDASYLIRRYKDLSGGEQEQPRLQLLLALMDEQVGNHTAAINVLEKLRRDSRVAGPVRDQAILALGRCYEALGDFDGAGRVFDLAAQGDSRSITPVVAKARMLQRSGKYAEAARELEGALEGRGIDDPELRMMLAASRLAEQAALPPVRRSWGDFERAVEGAERSLRVAAQAEGIADPQSVDLALVLAERDALEGRLDEADARLREALERSPANPGLWAARAELMLRSGQPEQAVLLVERGLEAVGDGARLRLALARVLLELGRGREAQSRLLEGIDRLQPDEQAQLWEEVGRLRLAQADLDGADLAFRNWAKLEPDAPGPVIARIDVALQDARIDDANTLLASLSKDLPYRLAHAAILLREAERLDPEAPVGDGDRGRDKSRLSKLEEAREIVDGEDGVLTDARELAAAHLLLGRIREAQGEPEEAVASYQDAWERGDEQALTPLTDLLARLGRFEELERLARESESDPRIGRLSAQALLGAGELSRASRLLGDAGDDPDAPAALIAWRARMLSMAGRQDELEGLLRRQAERADADEAAPWIDLIAAQARMGRDRASLEVTIRRALERASDVPAAPLEARLRLASGDPEGADAVLKEALEGPIADPKLLVDAASYYNETGRPGLSEPLLERLTAVESISDAAALDLAMMLASRAAGDPEAWGRALELVGDEGGEPGRRLARAVVLSRAPDPARRAEAVTAFEGLMADLPLTDRVAVQARSQLAALLIALGQPGRAAQVTAVSAIQPSPSPEAVALHARALLFADRLGEAEEQLDRLELLRPGDPEVAELRATRLLVAGDGDPSGLERAVDERLGNPGGDLLARAAVLKLIALRNAEAIEAAARIAERLGQISPGRLWALGYARAAQGRHDDALDRCAEALAAIDLTDPVDRIGLVDAILGAVQAAPVDARAGAVSRARPIVDELLRRRPDDPDLLLPSAILHHQVGAYQAEAEIYRRVLDRRPGDQQALYNLALVLSEGLDRPEEGLEQLDRLEAAIGPAPKILGARGVILTRLGRFDQAIRALERCVELEPTADRHYFLARAYRKAGLDDRFREQLDRARRTGLDPDLFDRWQRDEVRALLAL